MKYFTLVGVTVCALGLAYVTVTDTDSMLALTLMSNVKEQCTEQIKETYNDAATMEFITMQTHLNDDALTDHLVTVDGPGTCGSAGCIHELCISKNQGGGVTHIPFGYAALDITVLNTLTNGMRDLQVNNDDALILTWDGTQYSLTR